VFSGPLAPERHRALQLGVLHEQTDGLVELAARHAARGEEVFVAPAVRAAARGDKHAVIHTRFLWVDVDQPGQLHALWTFIAQRPWHLLLETGIIRSPLWWAGAVVGDECRRHVANGRGVVDAAGGVDDIRHVRPVGRARAGRRRRVVGVVVSMSVSARCGPSLPAGLFVGALYRSAPPGSLVEVRFRVGSGMDRAFLRSSFCVVWS
jgi:hypothetical protein